MKVILCDTNETICYLWKHLLHDFKGVQIHHGRLSALVDGVLLESHSSQNIAIVSPGNSFGYLGGGFDLALYDYFGGKAFETWFRRQLKGGYRPVGSATALDLSHYKNGLHKPIKYIIHTPTVVAPCNPLYERSRPVQTGYEPVFNAIWNALVHAPNDVETIIIPGLCTGYVGVPPRISCKSMIFGLKLFLLGDRVSNELKNVLIMCFLGYPFGPFLPEACIEEGESLGLHMKDSINFNVQADSIDCLLPFTRQ